MDALVSLANFVHGLPAWVNALTGLVAAASAVSALTPTPKDDRFLGRAYKLLDILALNIGFAKDR
jgi:hypothetical protein